MLKLESDRYLPVVPLSEYFAQFRVLVIPPWQREYSWDTGDDSQVETLLKDFSHFARSAQEKEYLLGSIILCEENKTVEKSEPLLIDGQQRSLTLTLFLMCCRKYIKNHNLIDGRNNQHIDIANKINQCLTDNPMGKYFPKVSMNQAKANEILSEIFTWSESTSNVGNEIFKRADSQTVTQKNLCAVAEYIYDKLEAEEFFAKSQIVENVGKILNGVKLIEITLDNKKESIAIFDRINDRGMKLTSADLIKNILFREVSDKEFDSISDYWKPMSEKLMETKKSRLQDPKYLIRSMAQMHHGAHLSYDDLVSHWEQIFSDEKMEMPPMAFAKELSLSAENLLNYVKREHPVHGALSEIYLSGELGSVQHYAVLLAGSRISDKKAFLHLLRQVNHRTLIYMLSKERTQAFDLMIPDWAHGVYKLGPSASIEAINSVYRDKALPDEERFEALALNMMKWRYTNAGDRKKIRAVLALMSAHFNQLCEKPMKVEDAMRTKRTRDNQPWEIEHVLPQSMNKSDDYQQIGNLVLLAPVDNREASNASPKEKKLHYNQSDLVLTKTLSDLALSNSAESAYSKLLRELDLSKPVCSLDNWDVEAVKKRGDFYFRYLKLILESVAN